MVTEPLPPSPGPPPGVPHLIYVGDPMCSWCWGFAPVLTELSESRSLPVEVIVGGLRPGPHAERLDATLRSFLENEWSRIASVTGQPFSVAALERQDWLYDTLVPAVAVTRMRALAPRHTLDFFKRVQRAFYVDGVDVTEPEAYGPLIDGFEVDPAPFIEWLGSDDGSRVAWQDFGRAHELGVHGYPGLLLAGIEPDRVWLVARGYRPLDQVAPVIDRLLAGA